MLYESGLKTGFLYPPSLLIFSVKVPSRLHHVMIDQVTTPQSHLIPVAILDADTTGEALPQQASAHLSAVWFKIER